MQQSYNPDGTRNRDYRPYIFAEETTYNTSLYDPFRSVDYGFYTQGAPPPSISNAMDIYYYEQKLHPHKPTNKVGQPGIPMVGWNPAYQKMDFQQTLHNDRYAFKKWASVGGANGSHPYRRLFATYT